jgi:hypothetical protein
MLNLLNSQGCIRNMRTATLLCADGGSPLRLQGCLGDNVFFITYSLNTSTSAGNRTARNEPIPGETTSLEYFPKTYHELKLV